VRVMRQNIAISLVTVAALLAGVFTGAPRARLEWPRDRRRPTLAQLVRIGESHGYRLVSRTEAEHVYILDFQRVEDVHL